MPALEPLTGLRIVANPDALDAARWSGDDVVVLRFASDEALGIGSSSVEIDDPDAIVVPEPGFAGARLDAAELVALLAHLDWSVDAPAGVILQGKVAGVPAKLLAGEPALLVVQAAYADELAARLGWRR